LGLVHGITGDSIFGILSEPEIVVDPFTKEELGKVSLVKGRVKAITVSEKFTIASSNWAEFGFTGIFQGMQGIVPTEKHEDALRVKSDEIKSWRAISEDYVQVGDEVEVTIEHPDEVDNTDDDKANKEKDEKSDTEDGQLKKV
jgi:hypothetical protein